MAANYPLAGAPQYALTTGSRIFRTLAPASQSDLVLKIAQALIDADWVFVSTITNGQRLACLSPQGYSARVDVFYGPGGFGRNPVYIQFNSAGTTGFQHAVDYQTGVTYQIVANQCSLFLSRPLVLYSFAGSAICGGIPRVDSGCGFGTDQISEIWWSMGDYLGGFSSLGAYGRNPRITIGNYPGGPGINIGGSEQGNIDGTLVSGNQNQAGFPQIVRISSGAPDDPFSTTINSHPKWVDGVPVLYPAFVAWGNSIDSGLRIRGQLYDAACRSKAYDMDTTETWDGFDWINYTHQHYFGSLWLISAAHEVDTSIPVVNVAY